MTPNRATLAISLASNPPAGDHPSLWSQVPALLLAAIISALVGLLLSRDSVRAFVRRAFRRSPVDVHIETDAAVIFANYPMDSVSFAQFVPMPIESVPDLPPGRAVEMGNWAKRLGGMPAVKSRVEITITAREDCHLVVKRVRVDAMPAPLPAGCVVVKGVGGAEGEFRRVDIQLAATGSTIRFTKPGGREDDPFEFELHPGESGTCALSVFADGSEDVDLYRWRATLDLLYRGKLVSIPITDSDKDFSLVNWRRRPQYIRESGPSGSWREW